jgi:hypothetical protein
VSEAVSLAVLSQSDSEYLPSDTVSSDSESVSESHEKSAKRCKKVQPHNRGHHCFYCSSFVIDTTGHWFKVHHQETEVKAIRAAKDVSTRLKLISNLRSMGDCRHSFTTESVDVQPDVGNGSSLALEVSEHPAELSVESQTKDYRRSPELTASLYAADGDACDKSLEISKDVDELRVSRRCLVLFLWYVSNAHLPSLDDETQRKRMWLKYCLQTTKI